MAKNLNSGMINAANVHIGDRTTIRIVKSRRSAATSYPPGCVGADLAKPSKRHARGSQF